MNDGIKREIEKEIRENGIQDTAFYDVYKTSTGLYLPEDICNIYNVGNREDVKEIKEHVCYRVNDQDLNDIRSKSSRQAVVMFPNIITIFDLQLVLTFNVLIDNRHENKLYIVNTLGDKYDILPLAKRTIGGITYYNVEEKDLDTIEQKSETEKIKLKRHYQSVELEDEMKPAEFLFIYYHDYETGKGYVNRDMFDLIRKNGIEIEGSPKIIDNKNCYSVTEEELKVIENQMGYRGVEQLLKPKQKKEVKTPALEFPNKDVINNVVATINRFKEQQKERFEMSTTPITKIDMEPPVEAPVEQDSLLVYKNLKTQQLFVPTDEVPQTTQEPTEVMNKPCYETSIPELENVTDKKIIVADYYPAAKDILDVIICNHRGHLFIGKSILEKLGFYIEDPHRIMISGEIYEEITDDDIDLIKEKESETCHINLIMKQISPKRG